MISHSNITIGDLKKMPPVCPEGASDRWAGIPHYQLAHALSINREWCEIRIAINRGQHGWKSNWGSDVTLAAVSHTLLADGLFALAILNDHRRDLGVRAYSGVSFQNYGMPLLKLDYSCRQVGEIDPHEVIRDIVNEWEDSKRKVERIVRRLEGTPLQVPDQMNRYLLLACKSGLLPYSRLRRVVDQLDSGLNRHTVYAFLKMLGAYGFAYAPPFRQTELFYRYLYLNSGFTSREKCGMV